MIRLHPSLTAPPGCGEPQSRITEKLFNRPYRVRVTLLPDSSRVISAYLKIRSTLRHGVIVLLNIAAHSLLSLMVYLLIAVLRRFG